MKNENIGALERGKLADVVLVKGNPLDDIECLNTADNVEAVFLGGKKVK
jgi:imidazolonepropionase-like amidohydrolase